jgi:carboxyl-terminal processing protease
MKHLVPLLLLTLPCLAFGAPCKQLLEYDKITATVSKEFYDRTFRGLDWPQRVALHRLQVGCDADERQVAAVLNELLAELHVSHTGVYTRADLEYWAYRSVFSRGLTKFAVPFSGIWTIRIEDRWHAKYVLAGSPAQAAGVLPGDELIALDGKPFQPLGMLADTSAQLTVSSDGSARRDVRLMPVTASLQQFLLDASVQSRTLLATNGKQVGYFHLWSGTHPAFKDAFAAALQAFEQARVDVLLIDLRGGFGGAGPEYLDALQASKWLQSRPTYVLIDDGVRSGKEWIASLLKQQPQVTMVGSRTAGAFLAGAPFAFAKGSYVMLLAVRAFQPPDVEPIEGIGVEPDVQVAPCRQYCANRDPQLEHALELIRTTG